MQTCVDNRVTGWWGISGSLDNSKAARVFLVLILGAVGAIPLVFLTPPFQVPDEMWHFYRAYQLSEFRIRAEVQNGVSGGTLPASLPLLVNSSVHTSDDISYPATPAPFAETMKLASIPVNSSKRQFVGFPGSAFYSPLPYLPQVLGIAAGRAMGLGPLYLLYLGRLFNCLAALALVGLAVYAMPFAEEMVIVVGLLPMSLYLCASLSADAMVIACALLFTALSFAASTRGNWERRELVMAGIAAAVFCSVKPVYFPILLAGLVPGIFQPDKAGKIIRSHAIVLAVGLGVTAGWLLFTKPSMTSPLGGGHPSAQMSIVWHHPGVLVSAVFRSFALKDVFRFYFQIVGMFGWLTLPLQPRIVYLLPLASVVIIWKYCDGSTTRWTVQSALWHLGLSLTSVLLVMTAMYLMSAGVGDDKVTGVQGRYFIPILTLIGVATIKLVPCGRRSASRAHSLAAIAFLIFMEIVATDTTIIRAFHVF